MITLITLLFSFVLCTETAKENELPNFVMPISSRSSHDKAAICSKVVRPCDWRAGQYSTKFRMESHSSVDV